MLPDNTLNAPLLTAERPVSSRPRVWCLPLIATLTLHASAAGLIYLGWQPQPPPPPEAARSIKTQLVVMPSSAAQPPMPERPEPEPKAVPAAVPEPVAESEPVTPPVTAPVAAPPAKTPSQQTSVATPPDATAIARKQAEQQRQRELAQQQEAAAQAHQAAEALAQARQQAAEREAARQRAAAAAAKAADVSSYTPLTKAAPDYPRRALSRRLEGDCTVEYTVLPDGRVSDPQIVPGACEEQIFVRPSLAAAKDFVYQPRMINGQPVAVPGVRNTFRYRLETVSRP